MKKLIYSALFSSLLVNSFAQIVDFGLPQTLRGKITKTKVFSEMPAVDAVAQITQDEQNRVNGIDKIYRFGVEHSVNVNILSEASKQGLAKADQYISHHPAAFLGFKQPELQVGEKVKGIVISKEAFVYDANSIVSKSKNSIFIDHKFDYKITGVYGQ
jgi:hypothetical protein